MWCMCPRLKITICHNFHNLCKNVLDTVYLVRGLNQKPKRQLG